MPYPLCGEYMPSTISTVKILTKSVYSFKLLWHIKSMNKTNLLKKFLLGAVCVMIAFSFVACGSGTKSVTEDNFSLSISADKTAAVIGETVKVTAELKNLSGRNVKIQMWHTSWKKPEDMLSVVCLPEYTEDRFMMTSVAGSLRKITIKKDAVISRTIEFEITEAVTHEAEVRVHMYTGSGYKEKLIIKSEIIKIFV